MKCRLCGNCHKNKTILAKEMFLGTKDEFDYILCSSCGSLSIETIPNNLHMYYQKYQSLACKKITDTKKDYFIKHLLVSNRFLFIRKVLHFYLDRIQYLKAEELLRIASFFPLKIPKSSKILDVGCGKGDFLRDLSSLGFQNLSGIDPFIEMDQEFVQGIRLFKKEFLDTKDVFDILTFHHSFEHAANPIEILTHIKTTLSRNGIAIIRLPNVDSYSFRKFRENWEGIHAPFHIFLPSQKMMKTMTEKAGLKLLEIRSEQMVSLFYNSISHTLGVCDYEEFGIRRHLESSNYKFTPPLLSKKEILFWREKCKQMRKTKLSDWIVYVITHD